MLLAENLNNKYYKRVFSHENSLQKKEEVSFFEFIKLLKNTNSKRNSIFYRELEKDEYKENVYFEENNKQIYFKNKNEGHEKVYFINDKLFIKNNKVTFEEHIKSCISDPKNNKTLSINTCEVYPFSKKKYNEKMLEMDKIKFRYENKRGYYEGEMIVFVTTLTGKCLSIRINKKDTIYYLKKKIALHTCDPNQQRLIFAGRQLNDDSTLEMNNIQKESQLHLVLRLRGGMRHFTSLHLNDNTDFYPIIECFIDNNFVKTNLDFKLCDNNVVTFNKLLNILSNKFKKSIQSNKHKLDNEILNKSNKKNKINDDNKWQFFFQMWKRKRADE